MDNASKQDVNAGGPIGTSPGTGNNPAAPARTPLSVVPEAPLERMHQMEDGAAVQVAHPNVTWDDEA